MFGRVVANTNILRAKKSIDALVRRRLSVSLVALILELNPKNYSKTLEVKAFISLYFQPTRKGEILSDESDILLA